MTREQKIAEIQRLESAQAQAAIGGMTREQKIEEIERLEQGPGLLSSIGSAALNAGGALLGSAPVQGTLKQMDQFGGRARAEIFSGIENLTGLDVFDEKKDAKARKRVFSTDQFQSGKEFLDRAGLEKIIGGAGTTIGGLAIDMVADPLTYTPAGALLVPKKIAAALKGMGRVSNKEAIVKKLATMTHSAFQPVKTLQNIADTVYRSNIKKFAKAGEAAGKPAEFVEEVFKKHGIAGNKRIVTNKINDVTDTLLKTKNKVIEEADKVVLTASKKPAEIFNKRLTDELQETIAELESEVLLGEMSKQTAAASILEAQRATQGKFIRPSNASIDIFKEVIGPLEKSLKKKGRRLTNIEKQNILDDILRRVEEPLGGAPTKSTFVSIKEADELKMAMGEIIDNTARNPDKINPITKQVALKVETLFRKAVENAITRSKGAKTGAAFSKNNAELGVFLSSRKAAKALTDQVLFQKLSTSERYGVLFNKELGGAMVVSNILDRGAVGTGAAFALPASKILRKVDTSIPGIRPASALLRQAPREKE